MARISADGKVFVDFQQRTALPIFQQRFLALVDWLDGRADPAPVRVPQSDADF